MIKSVFQPSSNFCFLLKGIVYLHEVIRHKSDIDAWTLSPVAGVVANCLSEQVAK